jgi:hypothetical protein
VMNRWREEPGMREEELFFEAWQRIDTKGFNPARQAEPCLWKSVWNGEIAPVCFFAS